MSQIPSRFKGAALLVALALSGCASPAEPSSPPAQVAGVVVSVLTDFVFVIDRSPGADLLVLTAGPTDVSVGETVSATGQVLTFSFDRFSRPYWLPDPKPFRRFEQHQCLLAAEVRTPA